MKPGKRTLLCSVLLCAAILTACGQRETPAVSESPEPAPELSQPPLGVEDLMAVLDVLDPAQGTLTWLDNEGEGDGYPAQKAICGASYLDRLRDFTWETYPYKNTESGYRIQYTAPGVVLTAWQGGGAVPFRLVTGEGEGWFTLPYIEESAPGANDDQAGWMIYDEVFAPWYQEAKAAGRYGGAGNGTPLTAGELSWFRDYTASTTQTYDDEWGGWMVDATPISCFFTSRYDDPRDMDAGEFLYYCPDEGCVEDEETAEFRLVSEKLDWHYEDGRQMTLSDLPVPCHRYSRDYINGILTRYAGVTIEEMHTDWCSELFYILETDCFYGFASDFGPGTFTVRYGEKEGDVVTLWEEADNYTGGPDVLKLQKVGEEWHILSHVEAEETK